MSLLKIIIWGPKWNFVTCIIVNHVMKRVGRLSRLMTKPTKWLCAQRRLRSAWASAQSHQSLCCPHEGSSGPYLPIEHHWAHSEDSDQTGLMPRLIWVFAGRTSILLVLSWGGSYSLSVCLLQYNAKSRTSAAEGMRHAFFNSFGPSVHRLPDSKYWWKNILHKNQCPIEMQW